MKIKTTPLIDETLNLVIKNFVVLARQTNRSSQPNEHLVRDEIAGAQLKEKINQSLLAGAIVREWVGDVRVFDHLEDLVTKGKTGVAGLFAVTKDKTITAPDGESFPATAEGLKTLSKRRTLHEQLYLKTIERDAGDFPNDPKGAQRQYFITNITRGLNRFKSTIFSMTLSELSEKYDHAQISRAFEQFVPENMTSDNAGLSYSHWKNRNNLTEINYHATPTRLRGSEVKKGVAFLVESVLEASRQLAEKNLALITDPAQNNYQKRNQITGLATNAKLTPEEAQAALRADFRSDSQNERIEALTERNGANLLETVWTVFGDPTRGQREAAEWQMADQSYEVEASNEVSIRHRQLSQDLEAMLVRARANGTNLIRPEIKLFEEISVILGIPSDPVLVAQLTSKVIADQPWWNIYRENVALGEDQTSETILNVSEHPIIKEASDRLITREGEELVPLSVSRARNIEPEHEGVEATMEGGDDHDELIAAATQSGLDRADTEARMIDREERVAIGRAAALGQEVEGAGTPDILYPTIRPRGRRGEVVQMRSPSEGEKELDDILTSAYLLNNAQSRLEYHKLSGIVQQERFDEMVRTADFVLAGTSGDMSEFLAEKDGDPKAQNLRQALAQEMQELVTGAHDIGLRLKDQIDHRLAEIKPTVELLQAPARSWEKAGKTSKPTDPGRRLGILLDTPEFDELSREAAIRQVLLHTMSNSPSVWENPEEGSDPSQEFFQQRAILSQDVTDTINKFNRGHKVEFTRLGEFWNKTRTALKELEDNKFSDLARWKLSEQYLEQWQNDLTLIAQDIVNLNANGDSEQAKAIAKVLGQWNELIGMSSDRVEDYLPMKPDGFLTNLKSAQEDWGQIKEALRLRMDKVMIPIKNLEAVRQGLERMQKSPTQLAWTFQATLVPLQGWRQSVEKEISEAQNRLEQLRGADSVLRKNHDERHDWCRGRIENWVTSHDTIEGISAALDKILVEATATDSERSSRQKVNPSLEEQTAMRQSPSFQKMVKILRISPAFRDLLNKAADSEASRETVDKLNGYVFNGQRPPNTKNVAEITETPNQRKLSLRQVIEELYEIETTANQRRQSNRDRIHTTEKYIEERTDILDKGTLSEPLRVQQGSINTNFVETLEEITAKLPQLSSNTLGMPKWFDLNQARANMSEKRLELERILAGQSASRELQEALKETNSARAKLNLDPIGRMDLLDGISEAKKVAIEKTAEIKFQLTTSWERSKQHDLAASLQPVPWNFMPPEVVAKRMEELHSQALDSAQGLIETWRPWVEDAPAQERKADEMVPA